MQSFEINNIQDWQKVINEILPFKHSILILKGNLGAGKTTFTQLLLKKLGSKDEVNSPTYSIINEYDSINGKVFHFDLYRLKSHNEVLQIGIEEYLDQGYLSIIEWPEIFEKELNEWGYHEMKIENLETKRHVIFK